MRISVKVCSLISGGVKTKPISWARKLRAKNVRSFARRGEAIVLETGKWKWFRTCDRIVKHYENVLRIYDDRLNSISMALCLVYSSSTSELHIQRTGRVKVLPS